MPPTLQQFSHPPFFEIFGKFHPPFVFFDQSNNNGSIDVKMDESVLEEKSPFKMLGLTFSSKLDWSLTLSLLFKLPLRKLEL